MFIDDQRRVAIIHVPKCGGTSVTSQLEAFDSYQGAFRRRGAHPQLGPLDFTHIPLRALAEHFPAEFDKVARYESFALTRDPHERFASATFHRLQEYQGVGKLDASLDAALAEARAVMAWLGGRGAFHDPAYIHFCPQTDFVMLDGRRVVRHIFAVEDMGKMARVLESTCGLRIDADRRENTNYASANRLFSILHAAKPVYSRLTTWRFRKRIMATLQKLKLQSADSLYKAIARDSEITRFVEDYYAADFELYRLAARSPETRGESILSIRSGPLDATTGCEAGSRGSGAACGSGQ